MAQRIPLSIPTHRQKVLSLYKKAARNLEDWIHDRVVLRYNLTLLRHEFDKNRNLDGGTASEKVKHLEQRVFESMHYQPKIWPKAVTGNAYGRAHTTPDTVLDYWHPLEKAQYPEYFARREQRKKEFIQMWDKEYGGAPSNSSGH